MPDAPVKRFSDLVKLAREHAVTVSEQERQSLPIPTRKYGGAAVAFFFAPAFVRPREAAQLQPPSYLIVLKTDGSVVQSRPVTPADFGQFQKPGDIIGTYGMPSGWTFDTYSKKYARLLECLDALMPYFASGATPADKRLASECFSLESELMEPPFEVYYRSIGSDFLNWLKSVSG
jgi:hypothetical protein